MDLIIVLLRLIQNHKRRAVISEVAAFPGYLFVRAPPPVRVDYWHLLIVDGAYCKMGDVVTRGDPRGTAPAGFGLPLP